LKPGIIHCRLRNDSELVRKNARVTQPLRQSKRMHQICDDVSEISFGRTGRGRQDSLAVRIYRHVITQDMRQHHTGGLTMGHARRAAECMPDPMARACIDAHRKALDGKPCSLKTGLACL